jgi:hypothetical protein
MTPPLLFLSRPVGTSANLGGHSWRSIRTSRSPSTKISARSIVRMKVMLVARKRASSSGEDGSGDGDRRSIEKLVQSREKCEVELGRSEGRGPDRAKSFRIGEWMVVSECDQLKERLPGHRAPDRRRPASKSP